MKYTNCIAKSSQSLCEVEISRGATRVDGRRGIECVEVGFIGVWATLPFQFPSFYRVDRVRLKLGSESCDVSDIFNRTWLL